MPEQARASAPLDTSAPPAKKPVSFWLGRKRPPEPQHDADRKARNLFDVLYAGAAAAGRWAGQEEFVLLTENDFDAALAAVASIQLGGR
jgi:hypothetical protein